MIPNLPETTAVNETAEPAARTLPPPEELRRRGLFAYHDGFRTRLVDVFDVQLRIQKRMPGGDMEAFYDLMKAAAPPAPDEDSPGEPADESALQPAGFPRPTSFVEAMVRLGAIVGEAFDLPPLDLTTAGGLSIQERVDLLGDFFTADAPDPDHPAEDGSDAEAPSSA